MSFLTSLTQTFKFFAVIGAAYVVLRMTLHYLTDEKWATAAVAGLTVAGVVFASIFLRLQLESGTVWYVLFTVLLSVYWYRANHFKEADLPAFARDLAQRTGAGEATVLEAYRTTRRFFVLGMSGHIAAFILAFIYFYNKG